MRTLLFLLFSFLLAGFSSAQTDIDERRGYYRTYQLPDGAVLKGRIIGRPAKDSVMIETRDGLVYHLSDAEAKKGGRIFMPPGTSAGAEVQQSITTTTPSVASVQMDKQPLFVKGASILSAELSTHFSSGGSQRGEDPESGIVASVSYLHGVLSRFKVGGGLGLMTVKSGSKERVFPFFGKAEYQIRPRISAAISAGYSIIPTNDFVLVSKNGMFSQANLAFDLVGPESAYTSRVGVGLVMQQLELGRSEVVREGGFPGTRTYTQYVERSGVLNRIQITFTHAWRMPSPSAFRGKKKKRK